MHKSKQFLKKPRNVYYSIIALLTLVTSLVTISFSYYIDDSSKEGLLRIKEPDIRLQSDELVDDLLILTAHETKEIDLYIMSNNDYDCDFKLYYETEQNAKVLSEVTIDSSIASREVKLIHLTVSNFEEADATIKFKVGTNNTTGKEIEIITN